MLNKPADEDKLEDRVTPDPVFKVRNEVITLHTDHVEQLILDTTDISHFGGMKSTQLVQNEVRPTAEDNLSIRIARDVWDADIRRKELV